jgi:hypothetical protein
MDTMSRIRVNIFKTFAKISGKEILKKQGQVSDLPLWGFVSQPPKRLRFPSIARSCHRSVHSQSDRE